jgi:hypothetical protein
MYAALDRQNVDGILYFEYLTNQLTSNNICKFNIAGIKSSYLIQF